MEVRKPRVKSVALLLINPDGYLFGVRELKAKPEIGKIPGTKDYSFPWETQEESEDDTRTLARLYREEVDATAQVRASEPLLLGEIWVHDTLARIYVAWYVSGPLLMRGTDAGTEIEPLGWVSRATLLSRCRDGVGDALELFATHGDVLLA